MRTEPWTEEPLIRHVGKDKQEQYYVYVLEAVVILDNGITLPLMSEFLNNEEYPGSMRGAPGDRCLYRNNVKHFTVWPKESRNVFLNSKFPSRWMDSTHVDLL